MAKLYAFVKLSKYWQKKSHIFSALCFKLFGFKVLIFQAIFLLGAAFGNQKPLLSQPTYSLYQFNLPQMSSKK
jgi:hypothetical protein